MSQSSRERAARAKLQLIYSTDRGSSTQQLRAREFDFNGRKRSPATRVQATAMWEMLTFLLEGLIFILIRLELPQVTESLDANSLPKVIGASGAVVAAMIATRLYLDVPERRDDPRPADTAIVRKRRAAQSSTRGNVCRPFSASECFAATHDFKHCIQSVWRQASMAVVLELTGSAALLSGAATGDSP